MDEDDEKIVELALGRIFRLASRPTQPGDVDEYERCRAVILEFAPDVEMPYVHSWARERLHGAQGD